MSDCRDIIVNIANFNTADVFEVALRVKGSRLDFDNSTKQTALLATVLFRQVGGGPFEVGVRRKCATGGVSPEVWKDVVGTDCLAPTALGTNTITGVAANVVWTGTGTEFSLDNGPFKAQTSPKALTGLSAGRVYKANVRTACAGNINSPVASIVFATAIGAAHIRVDAIGVICDGDTYKGMLIRVSFAGGMAAIGSTYKITFHDETDNTDHDFGNYQVQAGDDLYKVVTKIMGVFSPIEQYNNGTIAYFDFVSLEFFAGLRFPACPFIAPNTNYSASII